MKLILILLSILVVALFLVGCLKSEVTENDEEVIETEAETSDDGALAGQAVTGVQCTLLTITGSCTATSTGAQISTTSGLKTYTNKCDAANNAVTFKCNDPKTRVKKCVETCPKGCENAACKIATVATALPVGITMEYLRTKAISVDSLPDTDNDGIVDVSDNCPFVSNPAQRDSNSNGVGNACEITEPAAAGEHVEPFCTDSDETPYKIKGRISGLDGWGDYSDEDRCYLRNDGKVILHESFCDSGIAGGEGYHCDEISPDYACSDGACILNPELANLQRQRSCTDSDGGQDYIVAGNTVLTIGDSTIDHPNYFDTCHVIDNKVMVQEFFCTEDLRIDTQYFDCNEISPDYACRAGACVFDPA